MAWLYQITQFLLKYTHTHTHTHTHFFLPLVKPQWTTGAAQLTVLRTSKNREQAALKNAGKSFHWVPSQPNPPPSKARLRALDSVVARVSTKWATRGPQHSQRNQDTRTTGSHCKPASPLGEGRCLMPTIAKGNLAGQKFRRVTSCRKGRRYFTSLPLLPLGKWTLLS